MIFVEELENGEFKILKEGQTIVDKNLILHPYGITEHWTKEDLQEINIYRVTHTPCPGDKIIVGPSTFRKEAAFVIEVLNVKDKPTPEILPDLVPEVVKIPTFKPSVPSEGYQTPLEQYKERLIKELNRNVDAIHSHHLQGRQAIHHLITHSEESKKEYDSLIEMFSMLDTERLKIIKTISIATTTDDAQKAFDEFGG